MTCSDDCHAYVEKIPLDPPRQRRARVPGASRDEAVSMASAARDLARSSAISPGDALALLERAAGAVSERDNHAALLAAESARLGRAQAVIERVRDLAELPGICACNGGQDRVVWADDVLRALDGEPDGR